MASKSKLIAMKPEFAERLGKLLTPSKNGHPGDGSFAAFHDFGDIVQIVNESGADFERGKIAWVGCDLLINDDTPSFTGNSFSVEYRPAITLDPIKKNDTGRVAMRGQCIASVKVSDELHTHVMPDPQDTTKLVSSAGGPFLLLWHDGEKEAEQDCLIYILTEAPPAKLYIATSDQTSEGKVNVKQLKSDGTAQGDEIEDVKCFHPTTVSMQRPIRKNDLIWFITFADGKTFAVPVRGSAETPYEMPVGTTATAETTEWKIKEQPEGKQGLKIKVMVRLAWSGTTGDPFYQMVREHTYDSQGLLISVGREIPVLFSATGECMEEA